MLARLIGLIAVLLAVLFFFGFNLEHRSDISLIFYTLEDVPVFFTIFGSFIAGVIVMIPVAVGGLFRKNKRNKNKKAKEAQNSA